MCRVFISILICGCFLFNHTISNASERKKNAIKGPSIQISPDFAYYQYRSKESIVEEIELAGYKTVHYFVTNENTVDKELVKAFQNKNIAVWAMVLGNGTYSTAFFPKDWEEWKVDFIAPYSFDGFTFLSPFSKGYLNWKKEALRQLLQDIPFDGIEFAESYLPGSWEESTKASHGDVSENARLAFKDKYNRNIPEFYDVNALEYYKNDVALYKLWTDFRVDGVNHFLNELINGKGGVRETRPDILVATWSLGIDAGPNSIELLRTHNGLDVPKMVIKIKPDIHFIQTHYPDWIKSEAELPSDYFKAYSEFFKEIRNVDKKLPIGLQADIGSVKSMIKSDTWFKQFFIEAAKYGYNTATAYEYHLGGYMYTERPILKKAARKGNDSIVLSFSKRIDANSGVQKNNYQFRKDGKLISLNIGSITVDGNRVILKGINLPVGKFEIMVSKLKDTPKLWLFKDYPALEISEQTKMIIK